MQITESSILSIKNETYFWYMIFKGGTIRVISPVTEDGNRPKIIDGVPQYKEDHFPLSAKRAFEAQNNRLPNHLKKKIEVLTDGDVESEVAKTGSAVTVAEPKPVITRGKPGPKTKEHAQSN